MKSAFVIDQPGARALTRMVLLLIACMSITGSTKTSAKSLAPNNNQTQVTSSEPTPALSTNPSQPAPGPIDSDYVSPGENRLAIVVGAVGAVGLLMVFFLLRSMPKLRAEDSLRTFGVLLIIIGTLFFVAAGFSSEQIAPALGLFGTIAGYLLGRVERKPEEQSNA